MKFFLSFFLIFILSSVPGQAEWKYRDSGTTADLRDVFFIDELHGWAIGNEHIWSGPGNHVILATTDGGITWTQQTCLVDYIILNKVFFVSETTGYIVTESRRDDEQSFILATHDGGGMWNMVYSAPSIYHFNDVCFIDENTGWVAGGNYDVFDPDYGGFILHTRDGGETWEVQWEVQPEGGWSELFTTVAFTDENNGWALSNNYVPEEWKTRIYRTMDGGKSWEMINWLRSSEENMTSDKLDIVPPDTLWLSYPIWGYSLDGGMECTRVTPYPGFCLDYSPIDGRNGWAILISTQPNDTYTVYCSTNLGLALFEQIEPAADFYAIDSVGWDFVCAVGDSGIIATYKSDTTVVENVQEQSPAVFKLEQNYPNPFNAATTISLTIPETGYVTLDLYSITGQKVATLVDEVMDSGTHNVVFDGTGLTSGVYFYRFESPGLTKTGKMLLVK